MRHTVPDGDFAAILSRALDLLIEQLMKRRFGARGNAHPPVAHPVPVSRSMGAEPSSANLPGARQPPATPSTKARPEASTKGRTQAISRATRRTVCERDGLRCTWRGPDGVRCESRAWLENDHADPRGRGGSSEPENIRLLCRAHNQRAAELHYGRSHMADAIVRARRQRAPASSPTPPRT
jgi:hypothetical protein